MNSPKNSTKIKYIVIEDMNEMDYDYLHDLFLEAHDLNLTNKDLNKLILNLFEDDIIGQIVMYGVGDTCVRDVIYESIQHKKESILNILGNNNV